MAETMVVLMVEMKVASKADQMELLVLTMVVLMVEMKAALRAALMAALRVDLVD